MTKNTINVKTSMKEATELRISPEVVEEVTERLGMEIIPRLTRVLADRAIKDGRRTIQEKDLAFFDFLHWWIHLGDEDD